MQREDLYVDLMELIKEVADYVIPDGSPAKERIGGAIMSRTLKLRSETLLQEGMEKGLAKGLAEGMAKGMAKGEFSKAVVVFKNCISRGMSREDALAISELGEEDIKGIAELGN